MNWPFHFVGSTGKWILSHNGNGSLELGVDLGVNWLEGGGYGVDW